MKNKNQILTNPISLTIAVITVALFASCSTLPKAEEATKDEQHAVESEMNKPEEQTKETPTEQGVPTDASALPEEASPQQSGFATLESNGLKLLYPSEWTVYDLMETDALSLGDLAEYRIKKSEEDINFYAAVRIYDDKPDGGFEKRKAEARQFFELDETSQVTFEDVTINGVDFYKMNVPFGGDIQETILAAVKNGKCYDVFADFDKTNQAEVLIIEQIFNSIEIN